MGRSGDRCPVNRKARLDALRSQIGAVDAGAGGLVRPVRLHLPDGPMDRRGGRLRHVASASGDTAGADPLQGFRERPGLHEVCPESYFDGPLAFAFATVWLSGLPASQPVVWVRSPGDRRLDFGGPCPDGLMARGLDPARLIQVCTRTGIDGLWAMEEAVKAGAFVLGEVGASAAYDLTVSKRLHQAALASRAAILVLRAHDAAGNSAALTRWRLSPRIGGGTPWKGAGGLPGLGLLRLCAVLERQRGGPPQIFELEWIDDPFRRPQPAPVADRSPSPGRHRARAGQG